MYPQRNSTKPKLSRKFSASIHLLGDIRSERFVLKGVLIEAHSDVAQRAVEAFREKLAAVWEK